ncbi:hypothetical protein PCE1_002756 [Barthelona sp. PCE]
MPQTYIQHSERFSFRYINGSKDLVVTSKEMDNKCDVYRIDETRIVPVPDKKLISDDDVVSLYSTKGLRVSLLDSEILYQCSIFRESFDHPSYTMLLLLYKFIDNQVVLWKEIRIPCVFSYGKLLNENLWVYITDSGDKTLCVVDLMEQKTYELELNIDNLEIFVQEGYVYLITKESIALELRFSPTGEPYIVEDHPLKDVRYVSLDRTTNDCCFVVKTDEGYVKCELRGDSYVQNPLEYEFPVYLEGESFFRFQKLFFILKNNSFDLRSAKVFISQKTDYYTHDEVCIPCCDLLLLNEQLFHQGGINQRETSGLFPLIKDAARASFVICNSYKPILSHFMAKNFLLGQLFWDFYDNTLTVIRSSDTGEKVKLCKVTRFYDKDEEAWKICYVTRSENSYHLYIDDEELAQLPTTFEDRGCKPMLFNKYVIVKEVFFRELFVKDVSVGYNQFCDLVDNYLWVAYKDTLKLFVFDEEMNIIMERTFAFDFLYGDCSIYFLLCNDYAAEEVIVNIKSDYNDKNNCCHILFNKDTEKLEFKVLASYDTPFDPVFVAPGAVYIQEQLYVIGTLGDINIVEPPDVNNDVFGCSNYYSPKPFVLVYYWKILSNLHFSMEILRLNDECTEFGYEELNYHVTDFLQNCHLQQFTAFTELK